MEKVKEKIPLKTFVCRNIIYWIYYLEVNHALKNDLQWKHLQVISQEEQLK